MPPSIRHVKEEYAPWTDPEYPHDCAVLWREPALDNIELLRATFLTHAFERHFHDEFAIGVIERGTQVFSYRSAPRLSIPGSVVVLESGEVHTGQAATDLNDGRYP